jgi:hypothetical protein
MLNVSGDGDRAGRSMLHVFGDRPVLCLVYDRGIGKAAMADEWRLSMCLILLVQLGGYCRSPSLPLINLAFLLADDQLL